MKTMQRKYHQTVVDQMYDFNTLVELVSHGTHNYKDIIKVYSNYHKKLLGVKKCTPDYMWMLDLGVVPLKVKINCRLLKFWAGIMTPLDVWQTLLRQA